MELFGSTHTGFALKDSDINMNLKFSNYPIVNNSVSVFMLIKTLVICMCVCVCVCCINSSLYL